MAEIQSEFIRFDNAIKLRRYDENKTLAEKRQRVLNTLSEGIKRQRDAGVQIPSYRHFNQGSYDLKVGVKPLDGDYDIDVGIAFALAKIDFPDPVTVKAWVLEAVKNHTRVVEMKAPCVTVTYSEGGEPAYHVDLAIYSDGESNPDRKLYLARGTPPSPREKRIWTPSDPEGLTDLINKRWPDESGRQFRRSIRALKRWKDVSFPTHGNAAPRGIALAVAAYYHFTPRLRSIGGVTSYDDLAAIRDLVGAVLAGFGSRVQIRCPAEPFDDLCGRMSDEEVQQFKARLSALFDALRAAEEDVEAHVACQGLAVHFGDDFPVPEPDPGKPQKRSVSSSGNSG